MALAGLVAASPLLLAIGVAVRATSRGPILFRQKRVGLAGRVFTLCKFRTMRHGASGLGVTARDDPRVTGVGRWLRKLKLDELPELWHVVTGEMALVGPRPELPDFVDLTDPRWVGVLSVRPGLTDPTTLRFRNEERLLAAVEGDRERFYRDRLQPEKLRGQLEYLSRRTWRTDLAVLWRTVWSVAFSSREPAPRPEDIGPVTPPPPRSEPSGRASSK